MPGTLVVAVLRPGVFARHVEYVAEGEESVGAALAYVLSVLADPVHAALLGGGATTVAVAAVGYLRVRPFARDLAALRAALSDYRDLLPWLLRISFGMALVGAGFSGYYFSPAVAVGARLPLVALGFLLLFGLATRAAALAALALYLVALPGTPRLLLAQEYVGGLLAVALLGPGRPSADHVLSQVADAEGTWYGRVDPVSGLARRVRERTDPWRRYLPTLVRATLGLNFAYLGVVEKLLRPGPALSVVAKYDLTAVVPVDPGLWVVGAGLAELAVGAALLAGLFTRAAAGVAFGLFTTTLFALPDDPVLAHLTLFGLVSVLVVTGSGPLSLDRRVFDTGAETGTGERDVGDAPAAD
jgi:uncharacterized membrane protein YphA (DoxX/SURF4 family)